MRCAWSNSEPPSPPGQAAVAPKARIRVLAPKWEASRVGLPTVFSASCPLPPSLSAMVPRRKMVPPEPIIRFWPCSLLSWMAWPRMLPSMVTSPSLQINRSFFKTSISFFDNWNVETRKWPPLESTAASGWPPGFPLLFFSKFCSTCICASIFSDSTT